MGDSFWGGLGHTMPARKVLCSDALLYSANPLFFEPRLKPKPTTGKARGRKWHSAPARCKLRAISAYTSPISSVWFDSGLGLQHAMSPRSKNSKLRYSFTFRDREWVLTSGMTLYAGCGGSTVFVSHACIKLTFKGLQAPSGNGPPPEGSRSPGSSVRASCASCACSEGFHGTRGSRRAWIT